MKCMQKRVGHLLGHHHHQPNFLRPQLVHVGVSGTGTSGQVDTVEEVGLDRTPSGSQHHTPSPDLEPVGEEEERPASQQLGGETLKQSWNGKGPTGQEWPEQPRTECDGEESLMACAPPGVMGISKYNRYIGHLKVFQASPSWTSFSSCL